MNQSLEQLSTLQVISQQENSLAPLEMIERAQIDSQVATARRFPRILSQARRAMLDFATIDEETAGACIYALPRGGKTIKGPSVRLAEIAVSTYGNLRAGSRIVATVTDGPTPHVVVQAVAHDLQTNVAITIEKRRRITKKKSKETIDEDDINLAANACSAIAFRDAVFKVIPRAFINPVFEAAKRVAIGDAKSFGEQRAKVVARLNQMGVTEERILAAVDARKVDDIDGEKLETLIGMGTALKEGGTVEEIFPAPQKSPAQSQTLPAPTTPPTDQQQATAATTAPTEQPKNTGNQFCEALEKIVTDAGHNFELFRFWGIETGNLPPDAKDWKAFADVPPTIAKKLAAAKHGLLGGLKNAAEVGAQ
jgi:hypothetical protein